MTHSKKVVIWGYPLYSHTHSFVHYGWFKAFQALGYETYWFHDKDHPADFDYSNCIFLTEGYADNSIPLDSTSVYYVHVCKNPSKYTEANCRLVDIRFNVHRTRDFTYDYVLDRGKLETLDSCTLYEKSASDDALREKYRRNVSGYEAIYTIWATDLLPEEFNFSDSELPRQRVVHHVGSHWSANRGEIEMFRRTLLSEGVDFVVHDPWKKRTTNEEARRLVQESYIAPDIRGSGLTCDETKVEDCNHLSIGYVPCRTFKNISYGQLGITNSPAVRDMMGDHVVYVQNITDILDLTREARLDSRRIVDAMKYVQEHHTFVNRIRCLTSIL
jgi:hypothetical protein